MIDYDATTALVVVDLQNDFADPSGSLYVTGGEAIIARVNDEVRQALEAGALVVATQDWHPESTPHFERDGGIWPVHCVGGTWGAELHPAFVLPPDAPRIKKGVDGHDGYSGFATRHPLSGETRPTELESILAERGIGSVRVCGLATDWCVNATAIDAARLGFVTTVLSGAMASVELQPGDGDRAIAEMADAGVVIAD